MNLDYGTILHSGKDDRNFCSLMVEAGVVRGRWGARQI